MDRDQSQGYDPTESSEPGSRGKIKAQALDSSQTIPFFVRIGKAKGGIEADVLLGQPNGRPNISRSYL